MESGLPAEAVALGVTAGAPPEETPHLSVQADERWLPRPDLQLNLTLTLVIAVAWELSARNPGKLQGGTPAPGASSQGSL